MRRWGRFFRGGCLARTFVIAGVALGSGRYSCAFTPGDGVPTGLRRGHQGVFQQAGSPLRQMVGESPFRKRLYSFCFETNHRGTLSLWRALLA
jgi:hypothetical protein